MIPGSECHGTLAGMVSGRGSRRPRRLRWLLVVSSAVTGISALRTLLLARNEKKFAHLMTDGSADPAS